MSGHSKWATIKHKKGAADKKRAKLFAKLIKQVEVAARQGGGDLDANATLRTMYQKARDSSVPLDTIEQEGGIAFENADLTMLPTSTVEITDTADARSILRLIDALDDNDDVQDVFANFDMPDEVLQAAAEE